MGVKKIATAAVNVKKTGEDREKKLEVAVVKAEYDDAIKQVIGATATQTKRGMPKVETKDEEGDGEGAKEVGVTIKAGGREKRERKTKTKSKGGEYGGNQEIGMKPAPPVKRRSRVKVEIKNEGVGGKKRIRVKLEDGTEEIPVEDEKAPKRTPKFEVEVDIKLEDAGMTMADRIKRRRRQ